MALGDMPLVPRSHIQALAAGFDGNRMATRAAGVNMPPALFGVEHFPGLMQLAGDKGARDLIADAPAVDLDADRALDIDTRENLEKAERFLQNAAGKR